MLTKIKESDLAKTLVSRLPLRPAAESKYRTAPMTGEEIRASFDESAKLIAEKVNQVIAFLTAVSDDSGVATLPYSDTLSLGETLEELAALSNETKAALDSFKSKTESDLAAAKSEAKNDVNRLQVKTFGDITSLDIKLTNLLNELERELDALESETQAALSELESKTESDLAAAKSEAKNDVNQLQVKTFGDITSLDIRLTNLLNELERELDALSRSFEAARTALENSLTVTDQTAQTALASAQTNERELDETQLEVASLAKDLDTLEAAHAKTAVLAENALPKQKEQGLYAHDYDSATGLLIDKLLKYSPTVSETDKGVWSIAQRDADGCLQAQPPKKDYQLTTKAYVESHFHPKTQRKVMTVSGRTELRDWSEGEKVEFGNGGEPTPDEGMKTLSLDGDFWENEEVIFYCDRAGAFVTNIYLREHPFTYDEASGLYVLHFTQKALTFEDGTALISCRVNAPIDATVYCDRRDVTDTTVGVLLPGCEYDVSGCGIKDVYFTSPDLYRPSEQGESYLHFSSNAASVRLYPGYPIRYEGDFCENGTLTVRFGMRYNLALSYDGVSFLCRVDAYPLPAEEEVEPIESEES